MQRATKGGLAPHSALLLPVHHPYASNLATGSLPAEKRGDGTGLYNLSRNIGSAVGISAVTALLTENTQANHADIAGYVTPYNRLLQAAGSALDPLTLAGRSALNDMVTTQATVIAYVDDFKLMMVLCLAALLLLLRRAPQTAELDPQHRR